MSNITGISITLKTADQSWAGTNDHLYLGVVGTVGGREFALGVPNFDDFEEGTEVTYQIGSPNIGGEIPLSAKARLEEMTICLPNVTHVYLRKQGDRSNKGDDAYRLDHAFIILAAGPDSSRFFVTTGKATFGNEHGLQVWLAETNLNKFLNAQIPIDGFAECEGP